MYNTCYGLQAAVGGVVVVVVARMYDKEECPANVLVKNWSSASIGPKSAHL
jgi:hypothetical protein